MVFDPNDATLGLSKGHSGNGPWSGVAGVAGVPIMSELIDSRAIFNVFLCYTLLHTHCHGRLERKTSRPCKTPFRKTHLEAICCSLHYAMETDDEVPGSNAPLRNAEFCRYV
jgi:hypothetical protein